MRNRNQFLRNSIAAALALATLPAIRVSAEGASADAANSTEEIVVTGSRIRGEAPVGLNVIGLSRDNIEASIGLTTDRIIREIPQVYNLGVSDASRGQSGGAGNIVFGNSINLHGIGPYATLTLLDGHRTVTNSRSVDPSVIPSLGLDRIEVVADGASAVYGSDAIAGVVNLVPRRSLDGVETSLRYGTADHFDEYQAGIAGGKVWDGGQLMVAFEHSFSSNLSGDDRDFFTNDQRRFGGGDYRVTRCNPGTLLVAAAATPTSPTGATPYAIPPGGVTSANAAALVAGTSNKCDLATGQDLLPEQKYNSFNATYTQKLSDVVELFADGFFSRREYVRQPSYASSTALAVPSTNAFFVRPPGTTQNVYVDYNFAGDLPRDTQTGMSENWEVTPGLRFTLPHEFRVELLYTYGRNDDEANTTHGLNNGALNGPPGNPSLGVLASSNPAVAFDPFGLHRTSAATLAAISNQIFLAPTLNAFKGYEARVNGPLFDLPGGSVRIAAGYEGQRSDVALGLARGNPGTPIVYRNFSRHVDSGYTELLVPIVGAQNAISGINKLELTAAVRYDKYSDVGNTTNPKFGLNYSPLDSLKFRASYGTSFRAPLISEIYGNSNNLFGQNYTNPAGGPTLLGFALSGQNLNLKPEEAKTWSVGFDWQPLDTTKVSVTYFNVKYEKQVANYLSNLAILGIENQFTGTGIILHGTEARDRVLQLLSQGITLAAGSFPGGDPNNVNLFIDGRNQNLGTSITRGIDFQVSHRLTTESVGTFMFDVSGSYFTKYEVALTPTGTRTDFLNVIFNPLKFKGRAAAGWEFGPVTTQIVFNYVNSYDNNAVTPIQKVDAYTPIDLSLTLRGDDLAWLGAAGKDLSLSLEAQNVFDQDPPYVNIAQSGNGGGGFDPTTTNPIGRLIGIRIQKSWR